MRGAGAERKFVIWGARVVMTEDTSALTKVSIAANWFRNGSADPPHGYFDHQMFLLLMGHFEVGAHP